MALDVITGNELNAYQGNANLGVNPNSGYAKADFQPLHDYALKAFEVHKADYEQKIKDKKDLEDHFNDPEVYTYLDEGYAQQVQPKLDRFKELSKKNLQKNPNSKEWYEFHDLHSEIVADNAKLKTVQTLKNAALKAQGDSEDPHEKERYQEYIDSLNEYKLGEDIPVYEKYFAFDEKHLPSGEVAKGRMKRVKGNMVEDVEYSMFNPLGLDQKAKMMRVTDPKSYQTGLDIAHTLLRHGETSDLNRAMAETYEKGLRLNIGLLENKYQAEFEKYKKTNPTGSFKDFLVGSGHNDELQAVYDGLEYLAHPVEVIPVGEGENVADAFSYSPDGANRLSVDDDTLRAIYGATRKVPGQSETVLGSELSKTPAEIAKLKAAADLDKEKLKTEKSKQYKNYQAGKKIGSTINPLPESDELVIAREAKVQIVRNNIGSDNETSDEQIIIPVGKLPENIRGRFGMKIPAKPKAGSETYAADLAAYEAAKSGQGATTAQMRFYNSTGKDITADAIAKMKEGFKLPELMKQGKKLGFKTKYVDNNGNIIGTTETLDESKQLENLKATSKGDLSLGQDLPDDVNTEE